MPELNEPQRQAVLHEKGPLLVFAGAGSGKTRVITYRVAHLLAEHRVPPYRILAVTFTNKAAGEMRSRLEQLAGSEMARDLWVGTFHATCARLLRRYHADVGLQREFVIYDDADQKAVVTRIIRELGLNDRVYPPKLVLSRIHRAKRDAITPEEVELGPTFDEDVLEVYRRYERALHASSAVDFDDLIIKVMRLAESKSSPAGEELRNKFFHVLVDEFQDSNSVQYRLVRALSGRERNLCVVGDDDQSIYSWRGADVRKILEFRKHYPDAAVVKLEQNYRSTKNIVAAALGIIRHATTREPKNLWSESPAGDRVRVKGLRDEREEAAEMVRIVRRETQRGLRPSEIAVFYRVNAQSRVLEEALRSEGLPYQIVGGMKFFERAEVKDLLAYLRLIDNPRSDADLARVINVPARGIGSKTLDRLFVVAGDQDTSAFDAIPSAVASSDLHAGAKRKLKDFHDLIVEMRTIAPTMSLPDLAKHVLEETGYQKQLQDDDTAESDARLENLSELVGSLVEFEEDCASRGEKPSLSGYLERVSLVSDVDAMKPEDCVTLMTVHSAKGLEFRSVVLTGMEEEMFPYRGLDGSSPEELDEERRLAYVAVTRARERLFVTHVQMRMIFGQTRYLARSRFLDALPADCVDFEGGASWASSRTSSPATRQPFTRPRAELRPGERVVEYDNLPDDDEEHSSELRPGDRVFHQRFGKGIVQRVELGATPTVVALFPGFGTRKIRAEHLSVK